MSKLFVVSLICWMGLTLWSSSVLATEEQAQQVAGLTSLTVYNLDTDALPDMLRPFLKRHKTIEGLVITDALSGERLFQFYRSDAELVFNQKIPEKTMALQASSANIVYHSEWIGSVTLYSIVPQKSLKQSIAFTQEEKSWIAQQVPIRYVYDPGLKPFEWKNSIGKHEGILADILAEIKAKSGLNLVSVPTNTWSESIQMVKNSQADMFSGIGFSNERKTYVNFTERNVFSVPYVVIAKRVNAVKGEAVDSELRKESISVSLFESRRVGVVKDYTFMAMLAERVPEQTLVLVNTITQGLQDLVDGEIDYFVLNHVTAKSYLYQPKFESLYTMGRLDEFDLDLKVAIRKNWSPMVLSILDKSIGQISDEKITEIYQKWVPKPNDFLHNAQADNNDLGFMIQVVGGFVGAIVLGLFVFWLIKGRPTNWSIKHTLAFIFFVIMVMTLITAVLVSLLLKSDTALQTLQKNNDSSIELMQELRQSSDDLTRFVRMYVLTQDLKYKLYFQKVLDIRNGLIAHPKSYPFSYWDEVLGGLRQIDHNGSTYNLKDKAQALEFSPVELDLVFQAYFESESLARMELDAMSLIEGQVRGRDGDGSLRVLDSYNVEKARNLVYSQAYYNQKALIMQPLEELNEHLIQRFEHHFDRVFLKHNAILMTIVAFVIMKLFFAMYAYSLLSRRVIKPLELFKCSVQQIQDGHYAQKIPIVNQDEMGALAESFNKMSYGIASRTQEIQNSRNFMQALLDSEEQMVITLDNTGLIQSCNCAFLQFYGVSKLSDFIEQHQYMSNTFDTEVPDEYLHANMAGTHWSDYVVQNPNKSNYVQIIWQDKAYVFSVSASNLPALGEGLGSVKSAVFTDITALEQQKKQTEAVISGFMYPVIITEKTTGLVVYANQFFFSQFEVSSEHKLIGTKLSHFYVSKIDQKNILTIFETNGVLENYELRYQTEKNNIFDAMLKLQNIVFDGKECIMGVIVDLSQQKEQQRALEEAQSIIASEVAERKQSEMLAKTAQKQLENMTNSIPGAVFQCQRVNNDYQMAFISQTIQALQGVASNAVLDDISLFFNSVLEEDRAEVLESFNVACDSLTSFDVEYRVLLNNFTLIWIRLEATVSVVEKGGELFKVLINGSLMDVTKEKHAKLELHRLHEHTRDSIEYASLIQQAIIPDDALFLDYFSDFFTLWRPKDIVGGDIYLFEALRHKDECLLMVIDCAGHGVPGAFVTMLVKAIEREIEALIMADPEMEVSPAWILSYFNKTMKMLLKQNSIDSVSNAGFDGSILYYNKKEQTIKFSGAECSLFYIDEGALNMIKGDRHSVGYKKSDNAYQFTEHTIAVKKGMQFYLTTDGYFDQNGGAKKFPYGKSRFGKSLLQHADKTLKQQEAFLVQSIEIYQGDEEQNDDICIIGFKV